MDIEESPRRTNFDAFSQAWTILWKAPLMWGVTSLIVMAIAQAATLPFAIPMQLQVMAASQSHRGDPLWLIQSPLYWGTLVLQMFACIFVYPFYTTMMRAGLRVYRGEPLSPGMIFEFNGMYWRLVGLWAITLPALFLGGILCYIPALFVIVITNVAQLLILERRMRTMEAIDLSARTAWPSIWTSTGVVFVGALASVAGIIACGIGILVTLPVMYIACGILYAQLFDPIDDSLLAPPPYLPR